MSLKLTNLNCCVKVCKRIAETCDLKDFTFLLSSLSVRKTGDLAHVGLEIPINSLASISNGNYMAILNMKKDETISRIYRTPDKSSITFDIKKETFIKSLLDAHINKSQTIDIVDDSNISKSTVIVDFSSPNIAKPFHVGHLRSTIVGNFVANILELNNPIIRLNYLGDWGTQIGFVKAGLELSNISDISHLENPMKVLYNAYTLANSDPNMLIKAKQIFSSLEKGLADDWHTEWEKIRCLTIEHLKKTYENFGIHFNEYAYESKYRASNISPVIELLKNKGLTLIDDKCLVMDMNGEKVPLFKSDGTSLYLVRDIAAALDRIKTHNCESIIYVVDKSQSEHLNKLKFAISKLTQLDVIHFVPFGRITGMSTRKGTSIFLEDILNETINKMAEQQLNSPNTRTSDPEVTKILGVTALMVYILRQRRNRDFSFSWENALQGTGDSGVKLQYTHSRLYSLEKKNDISLPNETDPTVLSDPIIFELIFELARYSEVVKSSQDRLESAQLVSYLFKLCNLVSRCLKVLPVKGQCHEVASHRLLLFNAARTNIASSMKLLGLKPLREM